MKERIIVVLNFMKLDCPEETRFTVDGIEFHMIEHRIGFDMRTAEELIRRFDGYADGIAISGLRKDASFDDVKVINPHCVPLIQCALRSPVYFGDELRELFANWTLSRLVRDRSDLFAGKRALFHCASISPFTEILREAGAGIRAADAIFLSGMPVILDGPEAVKNYLRVARAIQPFRTRQSANPYRRRRRALLKRALRREISRSDVFVSYGNILDQIGGLDVLKGKTLVIDFLTDEVRRELEAAGVGEIIEFVPKHPKLAPIHERPFSFLTAVLDQIRIEQDSPLPFEEFALRWVESENVLPNAPVAVRPAPRRCAFVIHPLTQGDLWKEPRLRFLSKAPKSVRGFIEKTAARSVPVYRYGVLRGAVSDANGQEVVCDLYAMAATPRQLLAMSPDAAYEALVKGIRQAARDGALIAGLGAYTKVIGDAGVTVNRRSPIPVTNGNSYSAATTLWAAREMVERMNLVPMPKSGRKLRAKAMIIGATGSIGRVAALLVSLVFDEVVLVARRGDKLLEVRREILALSPRTRVVTVRDPNPELHDTHLIVTATSNQKGAILDIDQVRPGAVICDCSRPLDISAEEAARRPDVMIIESGEVLLPGNVQLSVDIGLPKPSVYACLAETVLLAMEGRYEPFSLSKELSWRKVREIYKLGLKHGARLSEIRGPNGVITPEDIERCRTAALERLKTWRSAATPPAESNSLPGLTRIADPATPESPRHDGVAEVVLS